MSGLNESSGSGSGSGNGASGNGAGANGNGEPENGSGANRCDQPRWTVGGRTFSRYADFLEARDQRIAEFLERAGGETDAAIDRTIPAEATPGGFAAEPDWPIAEAVDESLENRFEFLSGTDLNRDEHATRYLIPGILAAGQPGGIFGSFMTLKTSLAADLLISLASGTPFLGRFPVAESGRVILMSGESGVPALASIMRRICAERGLSLAKLDNLLVSPEVPRLDRPVDLLALRELIDEEKPICLVIDPAYLAVENGNIRNLFAMGALLRPLAELCEATGCAILLVHHAKRSQHAGTPPTLDDIAWSGFAEFSAQWLLVGRRRAYTPGTGHHELWLSAGGRAGHHGLWALDVDEGASPALSDDGLLVSRGDTRVWKTALRPVAWAEAQSDEQFVAATEDRRLRRRAMQFDRQCQRVLEYLAAFPDGQKARRIRDVLGLSGDRLTRILDTLVARGTVAKSDEIGDRGRRTAIYARSAVTDLSAAAVQSGAAHRPDPKVYDLGTGQFVDQRDTLIQREKPAVLRSAPAPDGQPASSEGQAASPQASDRVD